MELLKEYKLYFGLFVVLFLIRVSPYSCGSHVLDEVLNEFAVGGATSTLIAWLILFQDDKKEKKKNESLRLVIMYPFANSIVEYMQNLCFVCSFMPPTDRSRKENFQTWYMEYKTKCEVKEKNEDFHAIPYEELKQLQQKITNYGEGILSNKVWLSKEKIMTKEDFDTIHDIISVFVLNELLLQGTAINHHLEIMNSNLNNVFLKSKSFSEFAKCEYSHDHPLRNHLSNPDNIEY